MNETQLLQLFFPTNFHTDTTVFIAKDRYRKYTNFAQNIATFGKIKEHNKEITIPDQNFYSDTTACITTEERNSNRKHKNIIQNITIIGKI